MSICALTFGFQKTIIRKNSVFLRKLRPILNRYFSTASKEDTINKYNDDIAAGGVVPVFRRSTLFGSKIAIADNLGKYSYSGLYSAANAFAQVISNQLHGATQEPIAYLCSNDVSHVIIQWAIWISGNIALPLATSHPASMLRYFVEDSGAAILIAGEEHVDVLRPISQEFKRNLIVLSRAQKMEAQLNEVPIKNDKGLNPVDELSAAFYADAVAMLLYTSGTTSKPKGVVWSHKAWNIQIQSLHQAWKYSVNDVVLLTLPLHHVHGQLNVVNATLAAGATLSMIDSFSPHRVWSKLLAMNVGDDDKITMFHAVPTIYSRLLEEYEKIFTTNRQKEYVKQSLITKIRLMCSGSAPLPVPLFHKWEEISGHRLLERYGMTEVGMALSNVYEPKEERTPGTVGSPLPGITIRLVDPLTTKTKPQSLLTISSTIPNANLDPATFGLRVEKDLFAENPKTREEQSIITEKGAGVTGDDGIKGDLLVRGPGIFDGYWRRPEQTKSEFTADGWFITGDTVLFEKGKLSILGRTSVDIIKSGGYKVSALQVETALLANAKLSDVAVLGLEDQDWGEKIAAVVVTKGKQDIELKELRDAARELLAPYQLPTVLFVLDSMPRNIMGKVDKKSLKVELQSNEPKLKIIRKA